MRCPIWLFSVVIIIIIIIIIIIVAVVIITAVIYNHNLKWRLCIARVQPWTAGTSRLHVRIPLDALIPSFTCCHEMG